MNYAYVDGSFEDGAREGAAGGCGAYGVVLLRPLAQPTHLAGLLEEVHDCNVTELRAVLAAVLHAPTGEALTVHTDNTGVLAALRRGSVHADQAQAAGQIRALSAERGITLYLARARRTHRHIQRAHQLANAARLAQPVPYASPYAESHLQRKSSDLTVTLRRAGERLSVPLSPSESSLPRSVQALLLAVSMAQANETLLVYHASKVAAALWQNPRRALLGPAQDELKKARTEADKRGIKVQFEQIDKG